MFIQSFFSASIHKAIYPRALHLHSHHPPPTHPSTYTPTRPCVNSSISPYVHSPTMIHQSRSHSTTHTPILPRSRLSVCLPIRPPQRMWTRRAGIAQWWSAGFMIEKSRVQVPAGTAGEFLTPGSNFCADFYFGIRSTPVLSQWHAKDFDHSAKSAGGRLQLNTYAPYVCGFA